MRRVAWILLLSFGCQRGLTEEQLKDPNQCASCHPKHFEQWSGSMHAYASIDPVFLAMNARGQRETDGALGDFCVKCHAPIALADGATTDGRNLPELPSHLQGITCYFCHQVDSVGGDHNNPLDVVEDGVMRGGIADPVDNVAHDSAYSPLHDRSRLESSSLCGSCNDIVTPKGVSLERTFAEWKDTLYAHEDPAERLTCGGCHMRGAEGVAAEAEGVVQRRIHDHSMPGVDVALTPFAQVDAQFAAVEDALDSTVLSQVCVVPTSTGSVVRVTLENVAAGHSWPSGAAQDRRVWVELVATANGRRVFSTGSFDRDTPLTAVNDENMWRLGDRIYGDDGEEVHMFWEAARYTSEQLPGPTERDMTAPGYRQTHVTREFEVPGRLPDEVTVDVHVRPIGLDVLDSLIDSGDLDPEVKAAMPLFTLRAAHVRWRAVDGQVCAP